MRKTWIRLLAALGGLHRAGSGGLSPEELGEYARMYSAEVEYSEDNLEALYDRLYEELWNG